MRFRSGVGVFRNNEMASNGTIRPEDLFFRLPPPDNVDSW